MDFTNSKASSKVMNKKDYSQSFTANNFFVELTSAIRIRTQRVESIIRDS